MNAAFNLIVYGTSHLFDFSHSTSRCVGPSDQKLLLLLDIVPSDDPSALIYPIPHPHVPSPCPNSQILWHSNFCFFLSLSRLNFSTEPVCFLFFLFLLLSLGAPYCFFFYYPIATFFISQSHDVLCDCDPLSWSSSCLIPPSRLGHHTNSFSSFVRAHHVTWR